jgi:hypothetical protein
MLFACALLRFPSSCANFITMHTIALSNKLCNKYESFSWVIKYEWRKDKNYSKKGLKKVGSE